MLDDGLRRKFHPEGGTGSNQMVWKLFVQNEILHIHQNVNAHQSGGRQGLKDIKFDEKHFLFKPSSNISLLLI
jgi:hypothetical protein